MIYPITMYGCNCDGCGKVWDNGDSLQAYSDKDLTAEGVSDSEWHICEDGKTYCPGCYTIDDNDNLVFKSKEGK